MLVVLLAVGVGEYRGVWFGEGFEKGEWGQLVLE